VLARAHDLAEKLGGGPMHEDGAPCSTAMDFDGARQSLPNEPRNDGAPALDPTDGPGMRFAFLIHPISEQTRNLMDQAVEDAIGWGARIVGLGSMTGDTFTSRRRTSSGHSSLKSRGNSCCQSRRNQRRTTCSVIPSPFLSPIVADRSPSASIAAIMSFQ
jgi:hypothetical protein